MSLSQNCVSSRSASFILDAVPDFNLTIAAQADILHLLQRPPENGEQGVGPGILSADDYTDGDGITPVQLSQITTSKY